MVDALVLKIWMGREVFSVTFGQVRYDVISFISFI